MNKNIYGQWNIIEMELWDKDFIDAEVEGYINFNSNGRGEFQFGYVRGYMDCHLLQGHEDVVNFSWEGNDEMDSAFGMGNASLKEGMLEGNISFHNSDSSGFIAVRMMKTKK